MKVICTVCSGNHLARARAFFETVAQHEPDALRVLLLTDEPTAADLLTEAFKVIPARDIGIPNYNHLAFKYAVYEFNTAVKPFFFQYLFERDETVDRVVFFDPDMLLYAPLDELWMLLEQHTVVLTPHILTPIEDDKKQNEIDLLGAGVYNLGFFAIARRGDWLDVLQYWQRRLYTQCRIERDMSLFVDQKWAMMFPCLFEDVYIWKHPGANVAYWNLHERQIVGKTVNGKPLLCYHFSGYDPSAPDVLSKHQDRFTLENVTPDTRALFADYLARLLRHGDEAYRKRPYAYATFDDGTAIVSTHRRAMLHYDPFGLRYPNPFAAAGKDFLVSPCGERGLLSIVAHMAHTQEPIVDDPLDQDELEYMRLVSASQPDFIARQSAVEGVNLIGYGYSETGVGEVMRGAAKALLYGKTPFTVNSLVIGDVSRMNDGTLGSLPIGYPYRASLFCINADMTQNIKPQVPRFVYSQPTAAIWHWELDTLPDKFAQYVDTYSQYWVTSTFIQRTLRKYTDSPVHIVPPVVNAPRPLYGREQFGFRDDELIALYVFDANSTLERKNPLAAVEAFRRAALPHARLVVKTTNLRRYPADGERLAKAVEAVGGVLWDGYWDRTLLNSLMASCDIYISLHRSEGFGLTVAEAMAHGKKVVVTDYGGTVDFVNDATGYPVMYRMTELERTHVVYPRGAHWAEPDIDDAAIQLVCASTDDNLRALRGQKLILDCYGIEHASAVMAERVKGLYA